MFTAVEDIHRRGFIRSLTTCGDPVKLTLTLMNIFCFIWVELCHMTRRQQKQKVSTERMSNQLDYNVGQGFMRRDNRVNRRDNPHKTKKSIRLCFEVSQFWIAVSSQRMVETLQNSPLNIGWGMWYRFVLVKNPTKIYLIIWCYHPNP